jgi:multidrug efflux pump subunit AcrA (membrane-fusion protein)
MTIGWRSHGRGFRRAAFGSALLALGLSTACHHQGPASAVRRASRPAAAGPLSTEVVAPGVVEPWGEEVRVAAKEAGWIAEIRVREGQRVEAGDTLARLDDAAQAAGVALATADVAELAALLQRARQGSTAEELAQARAERDAAAARAARARADAERFSRLMGEGLVARAEGERAGKDAEAESAGAASLEARYAAVVRGTRPEDLAAAARRLEAAQARLQAAEAALRRRLVAAPMAGTVLWSRYRVGELYAAGSPALFVLGDVSRLQIRVDVDEIDAQRVAVDAPATIRIEGSLEPAQGRVVWLSPKMGRRNLLVETPTARNDVRIREVLVETPAGQRLLPGARVWVRFVTASAS